MFTGFNLTTDKDFGDYYEGGSKSCSSIEKNVRKQLDAYLGVNGKIDGSSLQQDWFPTVKADIFISHSHRDLKTAIGLAGWLKEELDLDSFVDSSVWGYANDLLKQIDDVYCKYGDGKTYNYNIRNISTSHVHIMLLTALFKVIDRTECIFFLNTPNSVSSTQDLLRGKTETESPWIYSEIIATNLIRKKEINEHRSDLRERALARKELDILYSVDLSELIPVDDDVLEEWLNLSDENRHSLDVLYGIVNSAPKKG